MSTRGRAIRRGLKAITLSGALLALLALGGCTSKLDTEKAEREIQRGIAEQTGVKIRSVKCPEDVEVEKGARFNCEARAENGQRATVRVRQRDDEGNVTWRVVRSR